MEAKIYDIQLNNYTIIDTVITYTIVNLHDFTLENLNQYYVLCLQMNIIYVYMDEIKKLSWYKFLLFLNSYINIITWTYLNICTIYGIILNIG